MREEEKEVSLKDIEKFSSYISHNGCYFGMRKAPMVKALPSGIYTLGYNDEAGVYFEATKHNSDNLVDLPSEEYDRIVKEIDNFLDPKTRSRFKDLGYLYKRSALLYGAPGGGKTSLVNRISKTVIDAGGIVIFDPHVSYLLEAYKIIDSIEPNRVVMVIFEEFDSTIQRNEEEFLSLLDGETQKQNVIYVATTNYLSKIPPRVLRPGRFSSVIEVKFPNEEARSVYLSSKLESKEEIKDWAVKTDGLSIDDLKEVVLAVKCLGYNVDDTVDRIKSTKSLILKKEGEDTLNKETQALAKLFNRMSRGF